MTFTYTPELTTNAERVRLRIGDTDATDYLFSDEEINAALAIDADLDNAARLLLAWAVPRVAKLVDTKVGDASVSLSQRLAATVKALEVLEDQADAGSSGAVSIWVGGTSIAGKQLQEADIDRVDPIFTRVLGEDQGGGSGTLSDDETGA